MILIEPFQFYEADLNLEFRTKQEGLGSDSVYCSLFYRRLIFIDIPDEQSSSLDRHIYPLDYLLKRTV